MSRIERLMLTTWSKLTLHRVNLSALSVAAMIQELQHKRRGGGLTPNTAEIGLVAKDGTKWEYIEFSLELRGGPLSAFEEE
ncbi:unnamed protein product [Clavelina lepadiformis]|uniref:Uncharacterized protein n=1 Tax=Clavelina lepadiformis TaxID=159417 RepID=A0ABP0FMI2_CLALP